MTAYTFELAVMADEYTEHGVPVSKEDLLKDLSEAGVADPEHFVAQLMQPGYVGAYRMFSIGEKIVSARAVAK